MYHVTQEHIGGKKLRFLVRITILKVIKDLGNTTDFFKIKSTSAPYINYYVLAAATLIIEVLILGFNSDLRQSVQMVKSEIVFVLPDTLNVKTLIFNAILIINSATLRFVETICL